jgi:hypothetical protein
MRAMGTPPRGVTRGYGRGDATRQPAATGGGDATSGPFDVHSPGEHDAAMSAPDDAAGLVEGAVDLYTHAIPDRFARRNDDLALAREAQAAGVAAIVHRHHYSPTAERARLASDATGFRILGAILCNPSAGGIDPTVVEHALDMGAVWVGYPTVGARWYRSTLTESNRPSGPFAGVAWGPGDLALVDDDGRLTEEANAVLELAHERGAAVNTGYTSFEEVRALVGRARELGHEQVVLTNPHAIMRLSFEQLAELFAVPGVYAELTAYSIYPDRPSKAEGRGVERAVEVIERLGVDRVAISSDGGVVDVPGPPELLAWFATGLAAAGVPVADLRKMMHANPRRVLGLE